MTDNYDNRSIYVGDAEVSDNDSSSSHGTWNGKNRYDNYFRVSAGDGDGEIYFAGAPIYSIAGDGYVFDATPGADFVLTGYSAGFGSTENPDSSAYVNRFVVSFGQGTYTTQEKDYYVHGYWDFTKWEWVNGHWVYKTVTHTYDIGDNSGFTFDLAFDAPVSLITISDDGHFDVGVDNLVVSDALVAPIPGAALLGMLGLSVAGVRLRKKA